MTANLRTRGHIGLTFVGARRACEVKAEHRGRSARLSLHMDEQGRKERGETWRGGGLQEAAGALQAMARCILSASGRRARHRHQSASTSVHMQAGSPPEKAPKK